MNVTVTQMVGFHETGTAIENYEAKAASSYATTSPVATQVLSTYGVPYTGSAGSSLPGMDLYHVDAMSAVKTSLLGEVASCLKEPIVNEDGVVEFIPIPNGSLDTGDLYYQIQAKNFVTTKNYVKVTGGKPKPIRSLKPWKNLLDTANGGQVWDTSAIASKCNLASMRKQATITFKDPHMDKTANNDGVDSIFNAQDYEALLGWAWLLETNPQHIKHDTTIKYQDQTNIIISVGPSVGKLHRRTFDPYVDDRTFADCMADMSDQVLCSPDAVKLDMSIIEGLRFETFRNGQTYDKFKKVNSVFIEAIELRGVRSIPKTSKDALDVPNENNSIVVVEIDDAVPVIVGLVEGEDCTVAYNTDDASLCIQFFNNARKGDGAKYGEISFMVPSTCSAYWPQNPVAEAVNALGKIKGGVSLSQDSKGFYSSGTGCIFPKGNSGYLVLNVYVVVELDGPSVVVYDPSGKAPEIATGVKLYCAAMTLIDEPAPLAINGELIDLKWNEADKDPTTVQNLIESPLEQKLKSMDGGNSIDFNLPCLDKGQAAAVSSVLAGLLDADQGVETLYVLGPNASPKLGQQGASGGVVNSINYSYSDSGSYLINVTEGPRVTNNLSSLMSGPHVKLTETLTVKGHISGRSGDGITYKVALNGFGERFAFSGVPELLRVGDAVTCTIYNNPVEA
jgi:hypothetical protein